MSSKYHLIPRMTVDKNGHSKTVYVSPSSSDKSAMLSFAAPSISNGYYDDEDEEDEEFGSEWQNIDNPDEWSAAGFDASDAEQWDKLGLDPSLSLRWSDNHFSPSEAEEWRGNKFDDPDIAAEWRNATSRIRNLDMEDLYTLYEEKTDSYEASTWFDLLNTVRADNKHSQESISDLVSTMDGENPEAGIAYDSCGFPYSEWSLLANAGVKADDAPAAKYLQDAVDEYYQDSEGDEYVENRDTFLVEALIWMDDAKALRPEKYRTMAALIHQGEDARTFSNFRRNTSLLKYDASEQCLQNISKANKWANEVSSESASPAAKSESFGDFYTALSTIPELDDFIDEHGAEKVETAIRQGMLTSPQLRNYLELIPVAAISEGAL